MATAKNDTITKTIQEEVKEEIVTLTMTREEATVLRAALGCIGGGFSTYHKHTSKVKRALIDAGIDVYGPTYFTGSLQAKRLDGIASSIF